MGPFGYHYAVLINLLRKCSVPKNIQKEGSFGVLKGSFSCMINAFHRCFSNLFGNKKSSNSKLVAVSLEEHLAIPLFFKKIFDTDVTFDLFNFFLHPIFWNF